jgi:glycosyltransferase involved in cell wall biosynthesis
VIAPKVSVLMAVKDADRFFAPAVRSILGQTLDELELVVVLDGPSPAATELLAGMPDDRVRTVALPCSRGLAGALNAGLAACRAPFVARIDADDVALPERLARQLDEMDRRPQLGVLGTGAIEIDTNDKEVAHRDLPHGADAVARALLRRNSILHPSVMMRREVVLGLGGYNETMRWVEDYDLWLRCLLVCEVDNLPEVLVLYRVHPAQHSRLFTVRGEKARADLRRSRLAAAAAQGVGHTKALVYDQLWRLEHLPRRPWIRRLRRSAFLNGRAP